MKKVLLVATLVAVVILGACKSSVKPEDVAKKFLTHLGKMEIDQAKELVTDQGKQTLDMMAMMTAGQPKPVGEPKFEMKETTLEGDTVANVAYLDDKGEAKSLRLVKKDNNWKVDFKKEMPNLGGDSLAPQAADTTAVK